MKNPSKTLIGISVAGVIAAGTWLAWKGQSRPTTFRDRNDSAITPYAETKTTLPGDGSASLSAAASVSGGGRAFGLDKTTEVPTGNAVDAIRSLRPLAESGDAKAALSMHLKMNDCHYAMAQSLSEDALAAYQRAGVASGVLADSQRKLEECNGAQDLLAERGRWLEKAADAGLHEAQLLYANDIGAIVGPRSTWLSDPDKLKRYKVKAAGFLNSAAARGNIDAMLGLASGYANGTLLKRDPIMGYAYYRTAALAQPGLVPDALFNAYEEQMTSDDIARANNLARSLYRGCCGK